MMRMLAPTPNVRVAAALDAAAKRYGLDALLLRALAWQLCRYEINNVELWADEQARVLCRLHDTYGTWWRALGAFRWGEKHIAQRDMAQRWPKHVVDYAREIYTLAGWPVPLVRPPVAIIRVGAW